MLTNIYYKPDNTIEEIEGVLQLIRLGPGSLHERTAPILNGSFGQARILIPSENPLEQPTLTALDGCKLRIKGIWKRGALQINSEIIQVDSNVNPNSTPKAFPSNIQYEESQDETGKKESAEQQQDRGNQTQNSPTSNDDKEESPLPHEQFPKTANGPIIFSFPMESMSKNTEIQDMGTYELGETKEETKEDIKGETKEDIKGKTKEDIKGETKGDINE